MRPTEKEIQAVRASGAKDCCKDPANLERSQPSPDLAVNRCRACGCNHYRMTNTPVAPGGVFHDARQED